MERIRAQIDAGEWFVNRTEAAIEGALHPLWCDPEFWGERPHDAAYVT